MELKTTGGREDGGSVILLFLSVGTFTTDSVEPGFVYFIIAGKQFSQLSDKESVILQRILITRCIPVSGKEVNTEFDTAFIIDITEFTYHITLSAFPRRRGYGVVSSPGEPQAKSIMMLGGQDSHLETRLFEWIRPLFHIKFGRVEEYGILLSVFPLMPGKSTDTKMKGGSQFHLLSHQLLRSRYKARYHIGFLFKDSTLRKFHVPHIVAVLLWGLSDCTDNYK